ncbi:MAG TPA: tannase/feruloyl esterase family alpha/beta hydrolase [Phenylobacterium sp.]|nr:tannase/feruloyl esterase family alpha/beta hydrolase [Phenylobacterium sp.]
MQEDYMSRVNQTPTRTLLGLAAAAALLAAAAPGQARAADCASLAHLALPHAQIILATPVTGGAFQDDTRLPDGEVHVFRDLPAFCRVRGVSRPTADSEIEFEVWLPQAGWTRRLHMVGNGGYSSNLYYAQMAQRLRTGDVAVATNTGHRGKDLAFGIGHPEKIADFAHRAVHESAVAAKAVTAAYYGQPAAHSYFSGCSTGGYQALMEAQRYPDDFDGIIAGAPGNNRSALNMAFLWNYQANHRAGDDLHPLLDAEDLKLIDRAVVARCDRLDGVADGVVNDPRICRFDVAALQCAKGRSAGCLSAEQVAAARRIYAGPRDAGTGKVIYPGYPFGAEGVMASADDDHPGWTGYWANPDKPTEPQRVDFFRYWVFDDAKWNWWAFDWGRDVDAVRRKMAATFDATSPNLRRFASRHGKLIMFMGWQDPVGAPPEAINYARAVHAATPGADGFLRLYMVPGMAHCAGGPGATNFSSATRDSTPPVSDAAHDMAIALQDWVEKGRAPAALIATHYAGEKADRKVAFQRPLCPYPQVARYRGGPPAQAASFVCAAPKPARKG